MSEAELIEVVRELERVAREAGTLVMGGYRSGTEVHKKGEIDLVTAYDLASEALVVEQLSRSLPHITLVGEEAQGRNALEPSDGLVCYVDPIDGTTNFAHGHPFFAVSLGLCKEGVPLGGVIYAPALGVCWSGVVGVGATRNGEPCRVSSEARVLQDALCATGFGYDVVGAADDNITEFRVVQERSRAIRRCGAAALDLALVADGTYDAYWEFLLRPWDMAAGAALVLAAGGRACDFAGAPVDVRKGAVIASNGHVHDELTRVLGEVRDGRMPPER
jgi:myo-inositol-1(or 4)-monophosphatase